MIKTPFNYTGSKFKILEKLLPEMDYEKDYFYDLFCGGGSVYVNLLNSYDYVLANDIIEDLIAIQNNILLSDDIIYKTKELNVGKNNKEGFLELRKSYNESKTPEKLWALMLSSTNNMIRFNKKLLYNQTYGNRGWNKSTDNKVEEFKKEIRKYKDSIEFSSKHFRNIEIPSNSMVYCDPPYFNTAAGYNNLWKEDDDMELYYYLKKLGSSFMVSGSTTEKSPLIEKLIEDGYNRKELGGRELIIKNY